MITRSSLTGSDMPRVPVLDGIRGLAIILVMVSHFYGFAFGVFSREREGLDLLVRQLAATGWIGVDLFFVLSGFLITGILLDTKESQSYFKRFYVRRILRIFPLFYAFLLMIVFVAPHVGVLDRAAQPHAVREDALWYFSYLMNIGWTFDAFDVNAPLVHAHFWSLAVEEQFYLVWPLVVLALSRRALTVLCVALLPACFALRVFFTSDAAADLVTINASHVFTLTRIDVLALGALLAVAARSPEGLKPLARFAPYALVGGAFIMVWLFVTSARLSFFNAEVQTIGFTAVSLVFASLVALTVTARIGTPLNVVFSSGLLRFFGRYAYGLYVMHLLVLFLIANRLTEHEWMREIYLRTVLGSQIPASLLLVFTAGAISVAAAWLSWHLFEKQVLKLKEYFPYGTQPAGTPPSESPATAHAPQPIPEPSRVMPPGAAQ